jgi:hypothetical protein
MALIHVFPDDDDLALHATCGSEHHPRLRRQLRVDREAEETEEAPRSRMSLGVARRGEVGAVGRGGEA